MDRAELWNKVVEHMRKNGIVDEKPWRTVVDLKVNMTHADGEKLFKQVKESMEKDPSGDSLLGKPR